MKHIVIVGGGVIGLCCAYYARQRGFAVTLIERGGPAHDSCSLGNAGMIVPSHFVPLAAPGMVAYGLRQLGNPESPFALTLRPTPELIGWGWRFWRAGTPRHVEESSALLRDLNLASRAEFVALTEALDDDFGLQQRGLLMLCKTAHALADEMRLAERANRLGVPAQALTPGELAALDPHIAMEVAGGVYFPKDCHLSPMRFVAALTRALEAEGVRFRWDEEVLGWRRSGERIEAALTRTGTVPGDAFVLAGGAWSAALAKATGLKLPLLAGKGYSLTLPTPPQRPQICAILVEARVAVTPMGEALRFGGTMEIGGGLDRSVRAARVRGIRKSVARYYPRFAPEDLEGVPVWSGLRPCSPDGLPYLGRTARAQNLVIATGHAMMGLSLAPVTGKLVAQILADETPSLPIAPLRPDRYAGG